MSGRLEENDDLDRGLHMSKGKSEKLSILVSKKLNRTRNKNTFDDEETVDSETELKGLQFERPRQSHASIVCRVI